MYLYGREFKYDNNYKALKGNSEKDKNRNKISFDHFTKEYITIDTAYDLNKRYKLAASEKLMAVRQTNWYLQYWLLVVSMILMYPTPLLGLLSEKHTEISGNVSVARFWLFWTGIYVEQSQEKAFSNGPLYILITVLVLDKIMQGWQSNRYGCTLSKISEFKHLEEKVRLINEGVRDLEPPNKKSEVS
jgi:hypothetical protein